MKLTASHCSSITPHGGEQILLICRIDLKKIQELEKRFPWKHPGGCPFCGSSRLWGHGFVLRNFFGFATGLWLKRWRCPDCGAVHTCRPAAYLPGMQYPVNIQRKSIETKLEGKPFLKSIPRQSQQHWWRTFLSRCRETGNWSNPRTFHETNLKIGQLRVSKRNNYYKSWSKAVSPYLPFALTVRPPPFTLE